MPMRKQRRRSKPPFAAGIGWKAAYEEMEAGCGLSGYRRSLSRPEKDWRNAVERQESITCEASVRPRTAEGGEHVVDAATRCKAAARLNAAWWSAARRRMREADAGAAGTSACLSGAGLSGSRAARPASRGRNPSV